MTKNANIAQPVGVIGAGNFGTAIANLMSRNAPVLIYSRQQALVDNINNQHTNQGIQLSDNVRATSDLQQIAEECTLLFPIVPSSAFRHVITTLAPYLRPYHILIHGTKGFDLRNHDLEQLSNVTLTKDDVSTMSQVITQETVVVRVGCLSGPNLASEIIEGQPTATVIASKFDEVISLGKKVLSSEQFHVFGSHDIIGAELAGALKNVIAIGSGILGGLGLGKNIQALLITRGLMEMIYFGEVMGSTSRAFYGTAGVGDLVATATSQKSRNYTFGYRLGSGEKVEDILSSMPELAEGVRTLRMTHRLAKTYKLHVPITQMLYNVVFEGFPIKRALKYLVTYPYDVDVDFL
ncbi:MAG: NAD(P)H-dependent glycerol-3-phosphate dehydrogenase [Saprospiraceae bacterium]